MTVYHHYLPEFIDLIPGEAKTKRKDLREFDYGLEPLGLNPNREVRYKDYND